MLSQFTQLSDIQKREFIAKIVHNVTYSQSSYEMIEAIINMWNEFPVRPHQFFTHSNQLTNGKSTN